MTQLEIIETIGAILGSIGALLLATNSRWSGWGFISFLASNVAWLVFGREAEHWRFFAQQVVFTLTSLLGIWQWLVLPRLKARRRTKEARIQKLPSIHPRNLPSFSIVQFERVPPERSDDQVDALQTHPSLNIGEQR